MLKLRNKTHRAAPGTTKSKLNKSKNIKKKTKQIRSNTSMLHTNNRRKFTTKPQIDEGMEDYELPGGYVPPRRALADFASDNEQQQEKNVASGTDGEYYTEYSEDDRFGFNPAPRGLTFNINDPQDPANLKFPSTVEQLEHLIADPYGMETFSKEDQAVLMQSYLGFADIMRYNGFVKNKLRPIFLQQLHLYLIQQKVIPMPTKDHELLYPEHHILESLVNHGLIRKGKGRVANNQVEFQQYQQQHNFPKDYFANPSVQKYFNHSQDIFHQMQTLGIIPIDQPGGGDDDDFMSDDYDDEGGSDNVNANIKRQQRNVYYRPNIVNPFISCPPGTFHTSQHDSQAMSQITPDTELNSSLINIVNIFQRGIMIAGVLDYDHLLINMEGVHPIYNQAIAQQIKTRQPAGETMMTDFKLNTLSASYLSPQQEALERELLTELYGYYKSPQDVFIQRIFELFSSYRRNDVLATWTFQQPDNQILFEKLLTCFPEDISPQSIEKLKKLKQKQQEEANAIANGTHTTKTPIFTDDEREKIIRLVCSMIVAENAYKTYITQPFQNKMFSQQLAYKINNPLLTDIERDEMLSLYSDYIIKRQLLLFDNNEAALQAYHDPQNIDVLKQLEQLSTSQLMTNGLEERYNIVIQSPEVLIDGKLYQETAQRLLFHRLMDVNYITTPSNDEQKLLADIITKPKEYETIFLSSSNQQQQKAKRTPLLSEHQQQENEQQMITKLKQQWNNKQLLNELVKRNVLQAVPLIETDNSNTYQFDEELIMQEINNKNTKDSEQQQQEHELTVTQRFAKQVRDLAQIGGVTPYGALYRTEVIDEITNKPIQKDYMVPCHETEVLKNLIKLGLLDSDLTTIPIRFIDNNNNTNDILNGDIKTPSITNEKNNNTKKSYHHYRRYKYLPKTLTPMVTTQDGSDVIFFKHALLMHKTAFPADKELAQEYFQFLFKNQILLSDQQQQNQQQQHPLKNKYYISSQYFNKKLQLPPNLSRFHGFTYWCDMIEGNVEKALQMQYSEPLMMNLEDFVNGVNLNKINPIMKYHPDKVYDYILGPDDGGINSLYHQHRQQFDDNDNHDSSSVNDDDDEYTTETTTTPSDLTSENEEHQTTSDDDNNNDTETDNNNNNNNGSLSSQHDITNERFIGHIVLDNNNNNNEQNNTNNNLDINKNKIKIKFNLNYINNKENDLINQQYYPSYDNIIQKLDKYSISTIRAMILDLYQHDIMVNFKLQNPELHFKICNDFTTIILTSDELLLIQNVLKQLNIQLQLNTKFKQQYNQCLLQLTTKQQQQQQIDDNNNNNKQPFVVEYQHVLLQNKQQLKQSGAYTRDLYYSSEQQQQQHNDQKH